MAIIKIRDVDQGVNLDKPANDTPANIWSNASNMDFYGGKAQKSTGFGPTLAAPVSGQHTTAYQLKTPFEDAWIYGDGINLFKLTASSNIRIGTAADAGQGSWVGAQLGEVLYLTNGGIIPQYLLPTERALKPIPNFPANTTCKGIRTFKNFLFAFNLIYSGQYQPKRLIWSTPVTRPGVAPDTWYPLSTNEAGDQYFQEAKGEILDMMVLGDSCYVYTSDSTYRMDYTGGDYIFSFAKALPFGIMSTDCVAAVGNQHFVLTKDNVYLHDGTSQTPIAEDRVRKALFNDIDQDYIGNIKVVPDYSTSTMFIYIPEKGSLGKLTKAYTYQWHKDSWSTITIPSANTVTTGFPTEFQTVQGKTWATLAGTTWEQLSGTSWEKLRGGYSTLPSYQEKMVLLTDAGFLTTSEDYFTNGIPYESVLEKTGITLDELVEGAPSLRSMKRINRIYPLMEGSGKVDFYIGSQDRITEAPTYRGPYSFDPSKDTKVDCRVTGRMLAIKIVSSTPQHWALSGMDIEITSRGKR